MAGGPDSSPLSIPLDGFAICNSRGRRVSLLNEDETDPGSRYEYSRSPQPYPSPTQSYDSQISPRVDAHGLKSCSLPSPPAHQSSLYIPESPHLPPVSDLISFTYPQYDAETDRSQNSSISSLSYSRRTSTTPSTSRRNSGQSSQTKISKRRYECATCGKTFTTSGHVARHNRIHTGEKNFQCPEPGCSQRFSRQDNCMQHYRTHKSHSHVDVFRSPGWKASSRTAIRNKRKRTKTDAANVPSDPTDRLSALAAYISVSGDGFMVMNISRECGVVEQVGYLMNVNMIVHIRVFCLSFHMYLQFYLSGSIFSVCFESQKPNKKPGVEIVIDVIAGFDRLPGFKGDCTSAEVPRSIAYHGYYSYGSAAWSVLQAAPLALAPAIIIAALSPDVREPTPLESYLCRALALTLCAYGVLVVLLTGSVPLTSSLRAKADEEHPTAPYTMPTLVISLSFHAATAFLQYSQAMKRKGAPYYFASAVNALLFSIGLWCLLFATERGHISRKTGIDQRTSGYPFSNKEANKRK